jgi:hypothetical protein
MRTNSFLLTAAAMMIAMPISAQETRVANADTTKAPAPATTPAPAPAESTTTAPKSLSWVSPIQLQNFRALDQRGINVFEAPKEDSIPYTGFKLSWGAAFTQQFQSLDHSTKAASRVVNNVEQNRLTEIGAGFNNANANLYLGAQLAPGIRVALTSYLSARHHNETWVKDGYLLIDKSPIEFLPLQVLMSFVTVKAGHFEVNYGDAHFRRSDNGNAIYNPFVGNLIMDAFTTEIGGEVYVRAAGLMAMGAITGGEIRGNVTQPDKRSPAFISKLGFDRQLTEDLRVRLTGSTFMQAKAISNTLYAGDRAGSRYYWVLENDAPTTTESANFRSGMINPNFGSKVKSYMINPFVKFQGLEFFGTFEKASGRAATEATNRDMDQMAGEVIYRFLKGEKLYVAAKYNTLKGELTGITNEISVDRSQFAAGWFITPGLMLKGEYVTQKYNDFPALDIRNGAKFNGFMVEGVVAF